MPAKRVPCPFARTPILPNFANFLYAKNFFLISLVPRLINFYILGNQLSKIFIRRDHENFVAVFFSLLC